MTLGILTPSYRPDLPGLRRLHESVLRHVEDDSIHHVIVPRKDLELFSPLVSDRLTLWAEEEFLPSHFILTDGFADLVRRIGFLPAKARVKAVNRRHPWPPVRGWILQQIVKLEAARRMDADVIAVIDSDVVLIKPVSADTFRRDSVVRLYRDPTGVTEDMTRHVRWERAAGRLLGTASTNPVGADYIAGLVSWDPLLVAACLRRVEDVMADDWASVIGQQLHFSEFMLYGTYVDHFGTAEQKSFISERTLCHSWWDPSPLDMRAAELFIGSVSPDDVAVHVQSNSKTPAEVQDFIFREVAST